MAGMNSSTNLIATDVTLLDWLIESERTLDQTVPSGGLPCAGAVATRRARLLQSESWATDCASIYNTISPLTPSYVCADWFLGDGLCLHEGHRGTHCGWGGTGLPRLLRSAWAGEGEVCLWILLHGQS